MQGTGLLQLRFSHTFVHELPKGVVQGQQLAAAVLGAILVGRLQQCRWDRRCRILQGVQNTLGALTESGLACAPVTCRPKLVSHWGFNISWAAHAEMWV